jgi:hypothetical protein
MVWLAQAPMAPRRPLVTSPWTLAATLVVGVLALVLAMTSGRAGACGVVAGIAIVLLLVHAVPHFPSKDADEE